MATLGVHYQPDQMLIGDGHDAVLHPEWAVRAPVVLLTIVALYLLYKGVAKTFGRRAALLGGARPRDDARLVLPRAPDDDRHAVRRRDDGVHGPRAHRPAHARGPRGARLRGEGRARRAGASRRWHLVFGAILVCALPQILYLVSRNFEFLWRAGRARLPPALGRVPERLGRRQLRPAGQRGLPASRRPRASRTRRRRERPTAFGPRPVAHRRRRSSRRCRGSSGRCVLGLVLYMSWGERRTRRLYYLAAWFFAAISTLGKGPAGFGLPMLVTLRVPLRVASGRGARTRACSASSASSRSSRSSAGCSSSSRSRCPGTSRCTCATAARSPTGSSSTTCSTARSTTCTTRTRATTRASASTSGSSATRSSRGRGSRRSGLLWWLRRGTTDGGQRPRRHVGAPLHVVRLRASPSSRSWGRSSTTTSSPRCPPVAMLIGVVLDDMLGQARAGRRRRRVRRRTSSGLFGGRRAAGRSASRACCRARSSGRSPTGTWRDPSLGDGRRPARRRRGGRRGRARVDVPREGATHAPEAEDDATEAPRVAHAGGGRGRRARCCSCSSARDLVIKPEGADQPGAIRLLQLFTYNYRRAWPDSLDFSAALAGFGVVAVLARRSALAVRAVRQHAVVAMCAFGVRLGRLGPRRLHGEDGAALGPARGHRGLLRRPRVARTRCSSPTR